LRADAICAKVRANEAVRRSPFRASSSTGVDLPPVASSLTSSSELGLSAVEGWQERAGRNEAIFREVNESIARMEERLDSGSHLLPIVCECARPECATQIEIEISEYYNVRQHPDRFIVARGHEHSDIEQVLAQEAKYAIVEKAGIAAAAADEAS